MPSLNAALQGDATVLTKWNFAEGEYVNEGDSMCVLETPLVELELCAEVDGYVAKRCVLPEGHRPLVPGQTLCVLANSLADQDYLAAASSSERASILADETVEGDAEAETVGEDHEDDSRTALKEVVSGEVLKHILALEPRLTDKEFSLLKTLAREGDHGLLKSWVACIGNEPGPDKSFDSAYFLENAKDLAREKISAYTDAIASEVLAHVKLIKAHLSTDDYTLVKALARQSDPALLTLWVNHMVGEEGHEVLDTEGFLTQTQNLLREKTSPRLSDD